MSGHVGRDRSKVLKAARWALGGCLVALTLLALPTGASAQCEPLPGRSALDQYCESVPGAGGDKAVRQGGGSGRAGDGGRGGGSSLPPGVAGRLRGAGPSGQSLLEYAQSSAAGSVGLSGRSGRSGGASGGNGRGEAGRYGTKGPEADRSNNPLSAIKSAVSSGPSAGQVYLWVLIGIALIVAALGWLRYRARHRAGS